MEVYLRKVDELKDDLRKLLDLMSWDEIIQHGDTVLIKPNFCTHELRNGVTTNLHLLNALISLLEDRAGKIVVGETYSAGKDFELLREELDLDCEFINLSETETKTFESPFGTLSLPRIVFESKLINVPVLKTHGLTRMTLGIKNLFGLLQENEKHKYHHVIDRLLLQLLGLVKPALNILDATYSMDGPGPTAGNVMKTDILLASRDVVALDAAACRLIGINPDDVGHIALAMAEYSTKVAVIGDTNIQLRLDIPRMGKTEKLGIFLQGSPAWKIIMHPKVFPRAKAVKDLLKKL